MAAPFDNSQETSFTSLSGHTGEGIVIDIGTGDGRFVSTEARRNPRKFYIGIDANVKPLAKVSMKATRKPAKGGLPNVLFIQAAVEDLPDELDGVADEVHIHFPWGSLLRAVAAGDEAVLQSLRRICAADCLIEIIIGVDDERDRSELERLGLPPLTAEHLAGTLLPRYEAAGFLTLESGLLEQADWSGIETSWAKRLGGNADRRVIFMTFKAG